MTTTHYEALTASFPKMAKADAAAFPKIEKTDPGHSLLHHVERALAMLSTPLLERGSAEFGRNIRRDLTDHVLSEEHHSLLLTLQNKPAAVVLGSDQYRELQGLLQAVHRYAAQIQAQADDSMLASLGDQFDQLYARMNTPEGAEAMAGLSKITTDDLAANYRPGDTETA